MKLKLKYSMADSYCGVIVPFYYGYGYRAWNMNITYFYLIPFNYFVQAGKYLERLWDGIRFKESPFDKAVRIAISQESLRIREYWQKDYNEKMKRYCESLNYSYQLLRKLGIDENKLNKLFGEELSERKSKYHTIDIMENNLDWRRNYGTLEEKRTK